MTINCAERGLLLLRVRDEIRMSIAAYQTLYESSVAFGMRKALQSEQGKSDMEAKVSSLTSWSQIPCVYGCGRAVLLSGTCCCLVTVEKTTRSWLQIKQLEQEKKELERQVQDLKAKCEAIEKRESERRALEEKKHNEEIAFLKKTNAMLKQQLENLLSPSGGKK